MTDTAVLDNEVTETTETTTDEPTTKAKKHYNITPEQKRAAALRRDAAMLERLAKGSTNEPAMLAEAAKYRSEADQIAPAQPKAEPRPLCAFVTVEDGETHQCGAKATRGGQFCYSHSDPLTKLTDDEWNAVDNYFMGGDFHARLLEGFSYRQLKQIANPEPQA